MISTAVGYQEEIGPGDLILIRVQPGGSFPQDGTCDLGERCTSGDRWRPLGTARLRWRVDQTWTRHTSLVGAAALRVADLAWQGDPRRLPPTSEPHPGDRLVRGSPGGVWARTSPCIGGLSVASGMVIPQRCTCSNRTEDGGGLADMAVQIPSLSGTFTGCVSTCGAKDSSSALRSS